MMHVIQLA
jgi:hypothetical protein